MNNLPLEFKIRVEPPVPQNGENYASSESYFVIGGHLHYTELDT